MIAMERLQTLCAPFISGGDIHMHMAQDNSNFATFLLNSLSTTAVTKILIYKAEFIAAVAPDAAMPNIHEDVCIAPMRWRTFMEMSALTPSKPITLFVTRFATVRL